LIVGHSLGGGAAVEMAAALGGADVPVQLVVMLDPVGGSQVSSSVRRSVIFLPEAVKIISRSSRRMIAT
jgi:thioesterase domain-containing protein